MAELVNQYDPVAATAIINGAASVAERANAAYDAANPRPTEPAAFAQWFQNRNINRKMQILPYLDNAAAKYNADNPGGFGSLDAKGNFIRTPDAPGNAFLPGGKFADVGEADRQYALAKLGMSDPTISGRATFGLTPINVYGWNANIPKPSRQGPLDRLAAAMRKFWLGK